MSEENTYQEDPLESIKKGGEFGVKDGYFNQLEDKLLSIGKEDPELNLSKDNPFSVPEGYFDSLDPKAMMPSETSSTYNYWGLALVACVSLLIGLSVLKPTTDTRNVQSFSAHTHYTQQDVLPGNDWDIEDEDLLAYIETNYLSELEDEDIETLVEGTDVIVEMKEEQFEEVLADNEPASNTKTQDEKNIITNESIDDASIQEYLLESYDLDDLIDDI